MWRALVSLKQPKLIPSLMAQCRPTCHCGRLKIFLQDFLASASSSGSRSSTPGVPTENESDERSLQSSGAEVCLEHYGVVSPVYKGHQEQNQSRADAEGVDFLRVQRHQNGDPHSHLRLGDCSDSVKDKK